MSNLTQTIRLQQLASNPKNSSWVFASAGSGKTKVLTDRVLRLLLSGVKPDKILCLTFTKVAATEMQNRINSELAQWVLLDEAELVQKLSDLAGHSASSAELKKARTLFAEILDSENKIKIQTIHAFCQSLIKVFPFEAGIKPTFEVLEDAQEKLLLQKARKEVLKKSVSNPEIRNLVTKINSQLHDSTFLDLISELLSKKDQLKISKENYGGIDGVIEEVFTKFSTKQNQSVEEIFAEFFKELNQQQVTKLALALEESGLITNKNFAEKIRKFLQNPSLKKFSTYQSAFFTDKNEIRKINGKLLEDLEIAKIAASQIKLISDFSDQLNSHKICNSTSLLLKFTDHILENYTELKKQNAVLDYNDLIVETNRLLTNPEFSDWIKMKMDGSFDHVLIDESQDTNHQQWQIVKMLTEDFFSGAGATNKNRTIFIVGDEKQSIYSFQGAEADISEKIFSYFHDKLKDYPTQLHKIDLSNSFRSLPIILNAVDATFSSEKEKSAISKVSDFQGHKPIREGIGHFEIWPQIKSKKTEKTQSAEKDYEWKLNFEPQENYSEEEFLAENIALKIKDWVENGRILSGGARPVKYGDFMILLRRRTNGFDKILSRYFYQYQIPFGSSGKIKFSENIVIQDLLTAAKFTLSPHDDLNLAALLKSPIFGVSEEELFEICHFKNNHETNIYEALERLPKFAAITQNLKDLEKSAQKKNAFEFFYFLLSEENKKKIIRRFGSESLEILNKFTLKIFDLCENLSSNLQKLLDFIAKLNPEITLSAEKNNQVLITTVHSAKGLQAPIVMLPDCCFDTNKLRSTKEKISWIDGLPVWCSSKEDENKLLKTAREIKKRQAKDEYLRLLYVAMTRAEDELYIAGSGNSNDEECWYNLIKKSVANKCLSKNFFDEKNQKLAADKFEIAAEIFEIGDPLTCYKKITEVALNQQNQGIEMVEPKFYQQQTSAKAAAKDSFSTSQIRGRLIHKILEIFGKNSAADKKWLTDLAQKIIAREESLPVAEKNKIRDEILNFLTSKQFDKIFSGTIKCEAEITGDNKIKRIDLIVEKENEVLIIDYKSDEALPKAIPQHYILQLQTYKNLVTKIYPKKKITTAIFWTKFLKLESV